MKQTFLKHQDKVMLNTILEKKTILNFIFQNKKQKICGYLKELIKFNKE